METVPVINESGFDFFGEFETLPVDVTTKRNTCDTCRIYVQLDEPARPGGHLHFLPVGRVERQCLRTAPIIVTALASNKCRVIRGRRFSPTKNSFDSSTSDLILLYPGPKAVNIDELPQVSKNGRPYTIVLIDGTWAQARALYNSSPALHNIRQVRLNPPGCSEYVIKTQPSETCLSTVESAALALSVLEGRSDIRDLLLKPLHALCDFQLQHGAVEHRSKAAQNPDGILRLKPRLIKRRLARPKNGTTCIKYNTDDT